MQMLEAAFRPFSFIKVLLPFFFFSLLEKVPLGQWDWLQMHLWNYFCLDSLPLLNKATEVDIMLFYSNRN